MPPFLLDLWRLISEIVADPAKAIREQPEVVAAVVAVATLVVGLLWFTARSLYRGAAALLRRRRARQEAAGAVESGVEVIKDGATLLARLYNEETDGRDPLADSRIPYQPREPGRDLQGDLRSVLNRTRHLLITAPSGYGKTREAATLAASLMNEGYRVVRISRNWQDVPRDLPAELGGDRRRVLLLLDDLNNLFRYGNRALEGGHRAYRDRLHALLALYEGLCDEREVRVIATARDDLRDWAQLHADPHDPFWARFNDSRVQLAGADKGAVVALLQWALDEKLIVGDPAEFRAAARKNDGTFANPVRNLKRAHRGGERLTQAGFESPLGSTWRDEYLRAVSRHRAVAYIYDAADLLRQAGIELYPWIVEPAARLVWDGNRLQRVGRWWSVHRALRYLAREHRVLASPTRPWNPSDGQIEAKGSVAQWRPHAPALAQLLLRLATRRGARMVPSLNGLTGALYEGGLPSQGVALIEQAVRLAPNDAVLHNNLVHLG